MKVVQINTTCGVGSTGKIAEGISRMLTQRNIENYVLYSALTDGYALGIACADENYIKAEAAKSHLLGNYGFNSKKATEKIISELEKIKPDVVHLHNIHGHDCNLEMLFSYLREQKTKLVWTFHDCWAFTGYCAYFTRVGCDKWKTECENCPQCRDFSLFLDRSRELFNRKKQLFAGLNLTIVTPSKWLAELVKQSFLKDYPVCVINNGVDLDIFKPTPSDFREKHGINRDKNIVLGVAFDWGIRKGIDIFPELAEILDSKKYQIVLVGTNDGIDKKLPENIISIHRTQNQRELAEIYSAADVLVNPTREENFPTVNIEALACGTPVLTFKTGGSPEIIDENTGSAVPCNDTDALEREIIRICESRPFSKDDCIERAEKYNMNDKFKEYTDLYMSLNK